MGFCVDCWFWNCCMAASICRTLDHTNFRLSSWAPTAKLAVWNLASTSALNTLKSWLLTIAALRNPRSTSAPLP
eukprot:10665874-Karenia_brevis.AAC.1